MRNGELPTRSTKEKEKLDPEVSKQYREAAERGARTRGEGRIDP